MPDTDLDTKDAWVAKVLGLDPKSAAAPGSSPASELSLLRRVVTDTKNLVGDVVSETSIGLQKVGQAGLGVLDKAQILGEDLIEKGKDVVGWGTPPTAPPTGPVTLTSQADEAQPAPRTRTRLGVGERVVLTVTGGAGNWHTSAGKLSAKTGTTVTLTAPVRPGTAEVTVDVGGTTASLTFTVVAPNSVTMVRLSTQQATEPYPNAGMYVRPFFGPDDVNFSQVSFIEDDIGLKATGYWDEFNGIGHSPNTAALPCSNTVHAGRGTMVNADDHVWSGYIVKNPPLTDWTGQASFNIPWRWTCGSGGGLIERVLHLVVTDAAGTTTISKGGATFTGPKPP